MIRLLLERITLLFVGKRCRHCDSVWFNYCNFCAPISKTEAVKLASSFQILPVWGGEANAIKDYIFYLPNLKEEKTNE